MFPRLWTTRRLDAFRHAQPDARVNVLFPIETFNRELDYRLFLAAMAASPSRRIFLGWHGSFRKLIDAGAMRTGLYVGKSLFNPSYLDDKREYEHFKRHGFTLVYLDEEGAVYPGDEERWRSSLDTRIDPSALDSRDVICAWGEFQRAHYATRCSTSGVRIEATGHPRFDLYKKPLRAYFAEEAQAIQEEQGDFILVNTNVSRANNHLGLRHIFSTKSGIDPDDWSLTQYNVDLWGYQTRTLSRLVEMSLRVAHTFPDWKIILRPHPSERHETYREIFARASNVVVKHKGPVTPWIMASRAMIHDGCTTGLEAHLLDSPVVHFDAERNEGFYRALPNAFGARCETPAQVVETLQTLRETGTLPGRRSASPKVESLLTNFHDDSFERLLTLMDKTQAELDSKPRSPSPRDIQISEDRRRIVQDTKDLVRPLFASSMLGQKYFRQKFTGFDRDDIAHRFSKIEALLDKKIRWNLYSDFLLVVE